MTDVTNDTCELSGIPERFEVYSLWGHKAAGLGGIFTFSAISLFQIVIFLFVVNVCIGDSFFDYFFPAVCFFLIMLLSVLIFTDLSVKLYRFNLGSKIVIEKDRLTVGGRSWNVHSLVECIDIAVFDGTQFNPYTFHEYVVCDNNGKMIAYFDESYRNSELLKRWLQEGGCKQTCRDHINKCLCHIRKIY